MVDGPAGPDPGAAGQTGWLRRGRQAAALLAIGCITVLAFRLLSGQLRQAREAREVNRYFDTIRLAHQAERGGDAARAGELLGGCPAALRGWEWHYLWRLCHPGPLADATRSPFEGLPAAPVLALAFSPDGGRLAACFADATVRAWDVRTRKQTLLIEPIAGARRGGFSALAFSPDGKRLAAAPLDRHVVVWDATHGRRLHSLNTGAAVASLAFSPRGRHLASAGWGETVRVWDWTTGREVRTLPRAGDWALGVAFDPRDDDRLVYGGFAPPLENPLNAWDLRGGETTALVGGFEVVSIVAFSPDGARLARAAGKDVEVLFDESGAFTEGSVRQAVRMVGHRASVTGAAFTPDGSRLATSGEDGAVKVWDVQTGREAIPLQGHVGRAAGVAFSPDGHVLLSGGADGLRVRDGTPVQK